MVWRKYMSMRKPPARFRDQDFRHYGKMLGNLQLRHSCSTCGGEQWPAPAMHVDCRTKRGVSKCKKPQWGKVDTWTLNFVKKVYGLLPAEMKTAKKKWGSEGTSWFQNELL